MIAGAVLSRDLGGGLLALLGGSRFVAPWCCHRGGNTTVATLGLFVLGSASSTIPASLIGFGNGVQVLDCLLPSMAAPSMLAWCLDHCGCSGAAFSSEVLIRQDLSPHNFPIVENNVLPTLDER